MRIAGNIIGVLFMLAAFVFGSVEVPEKKEVLKNALWIFLLIMGWTSFICAWIMQELHEIKQMLKQNKKEKNE